MLSNIGWIGSIMLAICGLPQAIQAYRDGHCKGLNNGFLFLWTIGEIFTLIYILPKMDLPLLVNYSFNLMCLSVIIYFKIRPR